VSYSEARNVEILQWLAPLADARDDDGRPLAAALTSGKHFSIDAADGPVALVTRQAPQALGWRHPVTGLVPALLAATVATSTLSQDEEDTRRMDTIFQLLRADPSVLLGT
jgi:hypothetical protein